MSEEICASAAGEKVRALLCRLSDSSIFTESGLGSGNHAQCRQHHYTGHTTPVSAPGDVAVLSADAPAFRALTRGLVGGWDGQHEDEDETEGSETGAAEQQAAVQLAASAAAAAAGRDLRSHAPSRSSDAAPRKRSSVHPPLAMPLTMQLNHAPIGLPFDKVRKDKHQQGVKQTSWLSVVARCVSFFFSRTHCSLLCHLSPATVTIHAFTWVARRMSSSARCHQSPALPLAPASGSSSRSSISARKNWAT